MAKKIKGFLKKLARATKRIERSKSKRATAKERQLLTGRPNPVPKNAPRAKKK